MSGIGQIAPPASVVLGKDGVWLLEFDLGGRVERFATQTAEVVDEFGRTVLFRGGLSDLSVNLADTERIAIQIDDKQTDWMQHVARGGTLYNRRARLWFWFEGQTLETALLVLEGRATETEVGDVDAPTRLVTTLSADAFDQVRIYPDARAKVDDTTWTNGPAPANRVVDERVVGAFYPTPIGYPGGGDATSGDPQPSTPALMVEYNGIGGVGATQLVIASQRVEAASVHLWAPDQINTTDDDQRHRDTVVKFQDDGLGREVSYVEFIGAASTDPQPLIGEEFWIGWNAESGQGGGIPNLDRTAPIRGLGEVIEWALLTSGARFDQPRIQAQAERLNAEFKIDTVITDRVDLVEWLDSQLASVFPIRRLRSGRGIYYKLVNWEATADDAVARLDVSTGRVTRIAPYRFDDGQVANLFSLAYAPIMMGEPSRVRILAGTPDVVPGQETLVDDTRVIGSALCLQSQEILSKGTGSKDDGVVDAGVVTFQHTWSDSTANNILYWWSLQRCLPLIRTTVEGRDLEYLEPLDVIVLHDPDSHVEDRVALVDDVIIGGNQVVLPLTLLPRRTRLTE